MESSIAEFLSRELACELLPTYVGNWVCCAASSLLAQTVHNSLEQLSLKSDSPYRPEQLASQRSLHNAPIFRLLLKVAVNGTHQCDFLNFCGGLGSQHQSLSPGCEHADFCIVSIRCLDAGIHHASTRDDCILYANILDASILNASIQNAN
jgi:hypothetical protein